jgi:uncharacterized cupredoxin-like copper-binding protein
MEDAMRGALLIAAIALTAVPAQAAGDLSRQDPVELVVDLGTPETPYGFSPSRIELETGKLYKLVLRNRGDLPHYFTSHQFSQHVFTRKVQVVATVDGKAQTLAEFKGAIREIEVYPGHSAEWWLVPVATGRLTDLQCGIRDKDGKTHAEHGMVGEIVIR